MCVVLCMHVCMHVYVYTHKTSPICKHTAIRKVAIEASHNSNQHVTLKVIKFQHMYAQRMRRRTHKSSMRQITLVALMPVAFMQAIIGSIHESNKSG